MALDSWSRVCHRGALIISFLPTRTQGIRGTRFTRQTTARRIWSERIRRLARGACGAAALGRGCGPVSLLQGIAVRTGDVRKGPTRAAGRGESAAGRVSRRSSEGESSAVSTWRARGGVWPVRGRRSGRSGRERPTRRPLASTCTSALSSVRHSLGMNRSALRAGSRGPGPSRSTRMAWLDVVDEEPSYPPG